MKTISERDLKVNWHPYTQMQTAGEPIAITKGDGAWVEAEDGSRYLDAISSWWVNLHGHNHPYIMKAICEQVNALDHVIFSGLHIFLQSNCRSNYLKFYQMNIKKYFTQIMVQHLLRLE